VRENRTPGSVPGASGDRWLYGDVRHEKRGTSGPVKVRAWKGLATHHYQVLRLWRNGTAVRKTAVCVNKRGEAYTGYVAGRLES
jgi:hypothetical protein